MMILYRLQRHPIVMRARLRHVLVLTYALPERILRTLVPAGMTIETIDGQGLLAVAMVRAERMSVNLNGFDYAVFQGRDAISDVCDRRVMCNE